MTTKRYLKQIDRYDRMIQNKLSEVYQLRTMVSNISIVVDGDKVQTSGNKDILGNTMAKIYDLEKEIDEIIDEFVEKKNKIIWQIENMMKEFNTERGEEYYDVLTAKFVKCMAFDDIPGEVKMSERKMFYVYKEAIEEFEKLYGHEYLDLQ